MKDISVLGVALIIIWYWCNVCVLVCYHKRCFTIFMQGDLIITRSVFWKIYTRNTVPTGWDTGCVCELHVQSKLYMCHCYLYWTASLGEPTALVLLMCVGGSLDIFRHGQSKMSDVLLSAFIQMRFWWKIVVFGFISLNFILEDLIDTAFVQIKASSQTVDQAIMDYLKQFWSCSMVAKGINRPQWVKLCPEAKLRLQLILVFFSSSAILRNPVP